MCKSRGRLTKRFYNFATVTEYQMLRGLFAQERTSNKCVKFCDEIPNGCSEKNANEL